VSDPSSIFNLYRSSSKVIYLASVEVNISSLFLAGGLGVIRICSLLNP